MILLSSFYYCKNSRNQYFRCFNTVCWTTGRASSLQYRRVKVAHC